MGEVEYITCPQCKKTLLVIERSGSSTIVHGHDECSHYFVSVLGNQSYSEEGEPPGTVQVIRDGTSVYCIVNKKAYYYAYALQHPGIAAIAVMHDKKLDDYEKRRLLERIAEIAASDLCARLRKVLTREIAKEPLKFTRVLRAPYYKDEYVYLCNVVLNALRNA